MSRNPARKKASIPCRLCGTPFRPRHPEDEHCCGGCAMVDRITSGAQFPSAGGSPTRALAALRRHRGTLFLSAVAVGLFGLPRYFSGEAALALAPLFRLFAMVFLLLTTISASILLRVIRQLSQSWSGRLAAGIGSGLIPLMAGFEILAWILGTPLPYGAEILAFGAVVWVSLLLPRNPPSTPNLTSNPTNPSQ